MKKTSIKASDLERNHAVILGVWVDSTSKEELLAKIAQKLTLASKFYIVTPNPEIILQAQRDHELAFILNHADFSIPDGIGLAQARTYLSQKTPTLPILKEVTSFFQGLWVGSQIFVDRKVLTARLNVIKGRDLFLDLLSLANKKKLKVFLLGGRPQVNTRSLERLRKEYPNLRADGAADGFFDENGEPVTEKDRESFKNTLDKINEFGPDFLFVALGAPKQEKWIAKNIANVRAKCFMAVGGTLDYYSGTKKLPPAWIERVGLEWLWRFLTEPARAGRIFNAWPIFPLKVWRYKLSK